MLMSLVTFFLISSPYSYEIKSGAILEPTLGYLFQDNLDNEKVTSGLRLSYIKPDETDAIITAEIQAIAATSIRRPANKFVTNTDYFFETGFVFYEIYNPVTFRVAVGGGTECRKEASADVYYRGGLGRYFAKNFGIFLDVSGRVIFRAEKLSYPVEVN